MAIDYTSDIGMVRLKVGDTNESALIFQDEQIQCFLTMSGNNISIASISALETWATQVCAYSGDDYRIGDIEFQEGRSKANQLLAIINERKSAIANGLDSMVLGIGKFTGIYQDNVNESEKRVIDGEIVPSNVYNDSYDIYNYDNQDGPYN